MHIDSKFAPSCLPWTEEWIIGLTNINLEQSLWHHVIKVTIPLVHCEQTKIFEVSCLGELDDAQALTVGPFFHQE